ncbi:hypothetical protein ASJ81_01190 [Methanosarcina spelaei]|uniref:Uncharacterized protein n=1 Tax=Methanosarcina spelaei TaxID=1036679 RepID=A0A2A2HZ12_9EURY|nr:hypothetical protein [Methanosarcina spelaei]PAV14558.1 hypothetical protein ASJ81_01190 [Methanosarcina spelaei]
MESSTKLVKRCYEKVKKKSFSGKRIENERAADKLIEKEALSLLRTNSVIYVLSGVLPKKSPENTL